MTALFANIVTLRGFLGRDAEIHSTEPITDDAYAVLLLGTASGTWNISTNEWTPRIDWHRVICPGPHFCGATRGMKEGDHIEVEGELRLCEEDGPVVWSRKPRVMRVAGIKVRATRVTKVDRIGAGEGG